MTKDRLKLLDILQAAQRRPIFYIGRLDADLLESFLTGLRIGYCTAIGEEPWAGVYRQIKDRVIAEHGWEVRALSPATEMKQKGMTDKEIIDELLAIEIDVYQRIEGTG